jgi:signal transduction histidine kinase
VLLNRELFGWVLENLIKNALQAVDPRVGLVQVRISCNAETKGKIQIEVIDNGSGIPVAAQRKIFRAGFTTKKRGWGMGLTLVKRIVEEYHKGSIWLESSRPGETVFVMTLPAAQPSNDPIERGIHG